MTNAGRVSKCAARAALAAAVLIAPACGVRTAPRPPEDTQARPPGSIVLKRGEEGIRLDWTRPTRSTDGMRITDLAGFLIERESAAIKEFEVIADIPVEDTYRIRPQQDFSFLDSNPPAGPLRYRVRAYAEDSQIGRASSLVTIESETQ